MVSINSPLLSNYCFRKQSSVLDVCRKTPTLSYKSFVRVLMKGTQHVSSASAGQCGAQSAWANGLQADKTSRGLRRGFLVNHLVQHAELDSVSQMSAKFRWRKGDLVNRNCYHFILDNILFCLEQPDLIFFQIFVCRLR